MLTLEKAVFVQGDYQLTADVQLEVGKVTAVIGPSGAGKSTLLGGIAGFVPLKQGRLRWNAEDISDLAPAKRPVSMLFQDNNLFPHLTVMQNVALACGPQLRPSAEIREKVEDMLDRVGLKGMSARKPSALSGGQQSRATLARALLLDRDLMLMDEPFSALGPALKAEMLDLSVGLAQAAGRTLVMVTHDPADAERVADKVLGVAEGRVWPPQDTQTFLRDPPTVFTSYL
ncbi:ATP-binding cassette domain-containing protein [Octadecabacter sp. 1_MG-2023]|uniref:thiamine ABC transporter ATP-binding protein n=1 Tax=unclassified Octadecabacter TaxID=196158 RepID=UPI001C092719|nr:MULTISPECIES: ATP-binding cassette domain-containing protein [unclassified Octadecabacter]MBU2992210.1 ATP-binding cassette domain-containing protein [Octadecabacter sp. B2R22]MDO6735034.1 ATP-binding cassette domain-containing protein [Octadecabacter sp. 1_MG-2023]